MKWEEHAGESVTLCESESESWKRGQNTSDQQQQRFSAFPAVIGAGEAADSLTAGFFYVVLILVWLLNEVCCDAFMASPRLFGASRDTYFDRAPLPR